MSEQAKASVLVSAQMIDLCWLSFSRSSVNGLLQRFYEHFLTYPEIKAHFLKTDSATQHEALRHGLGSILKFVEGDRMGCECLKRIRKSHSRSGLNIDPSLYSLWIDSLLRALRQCDPSFNADTENAWRTVIDLGIDCIKTGY